MSWIGFALSSYALGALAALLDKYLLGSRRIPSVSLYVFFVAFLGAAVALLAPLGIFYEPLNPGLPESGMLWRCMLAGMLYTGGLGFFYLAIKRARASQAVPVVFSLVPLVAFLGEVIQGKAFLSTEMLGGISLLVLGGLLISFDLPLKIDRRKFFAGFPAALTAGVLLGVSYVALSRIYTERSFFSGFFWTRLGGLLTAAALFLHAPSRKEIKNAFKLAGRRKKQKEHLATGALFLLNKIIGGTGSILFNKALSLGSASSVNALASFQFVFVFLLALPFAKFHGEIFEESGSFWDWAQKWAAVGLIGVGLFLIS
ncbi:MAG TPA: DMT family transporter [Candidatus Moranbacteria bacterium]|nr:DMT family transporter [Candidatus Moranbacteria bacterium]